MNEHGEQRAHKVPFINDVGNWEGTKIGQDCRLIVQKTADMGEGVSKIRENCRRRLWMVPNPTFHFQIQTLRLSWKKGLLL